MMENKKMCVEIKKATTLFINYLKAVLIRGKWFEVSKITRHTLNHIHTLHDIIRLTLNNTSTKILVHQEWLS